MPSRAKLTLPLLLAKRRELERAHRVALIEERQRERQDARDREAAAQGAKPRRATKAELAERALGVEIARALYHQALRTIPARHFPYRPRNAERVEPIQREASRRRHTGAPPLPSKADAWRSSSTSDAEAA